MKSVCAPACALLVALVISSRAAAPDWAIGPFVRPPAGQALFAADAPARLVARLDEPFFKPEMPFEKTGQYSAGTTFIEGLVFFKGKWFLYYGCADSLVGVAVTKSAGIDAK